MESVSKSESDTINKFMELALNQVSQNRDLSTYFWNWKNAILQFFFITVLICHNWLYSTFFSPLYCQAKCAFDNLEVPIGYLPSKLIFSFFGFVRSFSFLN